MKNRLFLFLALSLFIVNPVLAKKYQTVSLVASSTQINEQLVETIKTELSNKGYLVNDRHLVQIVSDFGYVNTDRERARYLIDAMLDDKTDIVWFVKGGAGAFNLLPYLHEAKERLQAARPKVLVGFSDVTAIHSFVNEYLAWPSVHGVLASLNLEMAKHNGQPIATNDLEPIPSIKTLFENGVAYKQVLALNESARNGVRGQLRGGNMTLVQSILGTEYQPDFSGKILLLEDIGVGFRQLDRALNQLLFMKNLNVNAIVFGQFYPLDPTDEQRLMIKTVIERFASQFNKPVYYFPFVGHGRQNRPLILGTDATFSCPADQQYCALEQPAVSGAR